ncbi:vomeronasal 1 c15-like [Lynx pardinus]|uniref:Vomeronasal type-1 receptor n=1 Tax=Lynx pardinus TaxID=191816 RepID=A0A485PBU1_LYNPA|nr:vomeronasal 1 c15-like [Lynx pardinus]
MTIALSMHVTIKLCQFLQVGIGILANTFLLFHIFTFLLDHRPKPTDPIICHLAFVHIMKLFTILFLLSIELFESPNFLNDFKCKALFYMSRFDERSLHLHHLSPEHNPGHYNQPYHLLVGIKALFFTLTLYKDVYFIGVMLLSSTYMVTHLFRHQRRCQHLHSTSLSSRVSPKERANQTILLLVSFFVIVYWVDFIIYCQKIWGNVYATVSPLVLISSHKRIKICCKNVAKLQSILNNLFMK